ncbi:MAG: redoxin domain-containing protein [bacterium]|nr:redoxin domain-containing protein [bacterium]
MKKLIIVITVLAVAGMVYWIVGKDKLQNYYEDSDNSTPQQTSKTTEKYRLLIGQRFPTTNLTNTDGHTVSTSELLKGGKVVLFLDPGCNSCEGMISKWVGLVDKRSVSAEEVIGICNMDPVDAALYSQERRMNFRLYCDTARYFWNNHDVTDFPLQLVVGKSGTIHEHTFDVGRQIFPDQLNRWLQN